MDVELVPQIEKVVSLSSNIANQIKIKKQNEESKASFGRFYNGDRLVWLIDRSSLVIINTTNGSIYSIYNFNRTSSPAVHITHVVEFIDDPQKWKLLVVTTNGFRESTLHIFNVRNLKVDKTICIPKQVTSLEVISYVGGVNRSNVLLSQNLRYFHGIVAIGTEGGFVLLLDLGVDGDCELEPRLNTSNISQSTYKVSCFTGKVSDLPQRREDLAAENILLVYPLNGFNAKDVFNYLTPDNEILLTSAGVDVYVSSILYVQQMGCLLVGYNFGGFQIYDLTTLELVFVHETEILNELPVIQFAFQEPENDPKKYCYIWVIRGQHEPIIAKNKICDATLYSILFYNKTSIDGIGTCYLGVKECVKRFHFPLVSPLSETQNWSSSKFISCISIDSRNIRGDNLCAVENNSGNLRDEGSGCLCCCVFVFESYPLDKKKHSKVTIGIFDLNQWYQAQMPSTLRVLSTELCSYFGFFSLNAVCDLVSTSSILDVYVAPLSITRPAMRNQVESLFYPSALAFDCIVFTETCIVNGSFMGLHRQILHKIKLNAPILLIDPRQTVDLCVYSSLITQPSVTFISQMNLPTQREAIFSMALESDAIEIIMSCITGWAANRYVSEGCTLRFIHDWAWKKVMKIKSFLDKQCVFLYDCSGLQIDAVVGQSLRHHVVMLKDLEVIFKSLRKQAHVIPTTNLGARELEHRSYIISLLILHFDAVLWFVNARLLPETVESNESDSTGFLYPKSFLTRIYNNRRSEIQRINSVLNPTDLLLIDGIINEAEDSINSLWKAQTGNGSYPPSSINALLNIYLLPDLNTTVKHTVVQYFLLDLIELLQNGPYAHLCEPLSEYATSFSCSQSTILLTKGFWLLDHKDFEGALSILLHPMINSMDVRPWQSRRIMKAFLYQGEPDKALRYAHIYQPCKENVEDVQFYLTLLLANGLVSDAFLYMRSVRDQTNSEELIQHFFLGCQQTKNLRGMLQLLYSPFEEQSLIKFMTHNADPKIRELLVIYHLQRSHFIEALQLNDQLNSDSMHITDPSAKERATTRTAIIEGYSKVYPNVQLELAKLTKSAFLQRKTFWEKGKKLPAPLSTLVVTNPVEPVSKFTVLEAVMEKITEIWTHPSPGLNESENNISRYFLTQTPFTPRRNIDKELHQTIIHPTIQKKESSDLHFGDSFLTNSPTKAKYMDTSPFYLSETSKRRSSLKVYNSELLSLLQPCPIKRKPVINKLITSASSACSSPASILKQRNTIGKELESNPADFENDGDLALRDEVNSSFKSVANLDELKASKIRFLPTGSNKFASSSPIISTSLSTNDSLADVTTGSSPSPRRPLHSSEKPIHEITTEADNDGNETMDIDGVANQVTPQRDVESEDDLDDSIYETPESKSSFESHSIVCDTSHRSLKHKSYFSATAFKERLSWIKSELAKETVKDGDEITITQTSVKVLNKPLQKSLVEETVDLCFAKEDDDAELMKKFETRRKQQEISKSTIDDEEEIDVVGEDLSSVSSSVTTKNSNLESSFTQSLTPPETEELTINVEFPGITKASLRSYSPKSSPTLSQGSKSDKDSRASVEKDLVSQINLVQSSLEPITEDKNIEYTSEEQSQIVASKTTTRQLTTSIKKARDRQRITKQPIKSYAFSPPTVVESEIADITTIASTTLSPTSATFIFSTPLTRSRLKKVRKSIASSTRPAEQNVEPSVPRSSTQIRTRRSSRSSDVTPTSEALINFVSPALESVPEESTDKSAKVRHSMTLRKSKMKTKRIAKLK